ncbi:hypothetical protein MKW98_002725, partial [Papaver atlanticum]
MTRSLFTPSISYRTPSSLSSFHIFAEAKLGFQFEGPKFGFQFEGFNLKLKMRFIKELCRNSCLQYGIQVRSVLLLGVLVEKMGISEGLDRSSSAFDVLSCKLLLLRLKFLSIIKKTITDIVML